MSQIDKSEQGAHSSTQPNSNDSARRTQMGTQLDAEAPMPTNTQFGSTTVDSWGELPATPAQWEAGDRIGPFLLKRALGQGGMGMVWLAEQQFPLIRDVAIKVMLRDNNSALAEAYFEIERQALARLSHPAVAQIYDAGKLPDGALFFAMEYVPGVPLHRYLAANKTEPKLVAKLMMEVCMGIQHAHQRGLIHRDIKPANILVIDIDGVTQAKVIDFGIAVASTSESPGQGRVYDVAGTECYMSPEQRKPGQDGIDARADVYSLGAVLAESLYVIAGVTISHEGAASTGWREEITGSLITQQRRRRTDLAALAKMPNELRAIAIKALARERDARYDSAAAMADDLARWLRAEPVLAMPRSKRYILRCFVRRNALASAAAGLIAVALVGGIVVALYGLREAQAGRAEAVSALQLAEQRRGDAEGLVEFMLGDFAEKLRSIGRLDLLDAVGQEALAYLTKEQVEVTEASAMRRAKAYRTIAGAQLTREQFDQAKTTLLLAKQQLSPWLARSKDAEMHSLASAIEFRLGRISFLARDYSTTEDHWLDHLREARQVVKLSTNPLGGQRELSDALLNLGVLETLDGRNRWELAQQYFRDSIDIKTKLVEADSSEPRDVLANAWAWVARAQEEQGLSHAAQASQLRAVAILVDSRAAKHAEPAKLVIESELQFEAAMLASDLNQKQRMAEHLMIALDKANELAEIEPGDVSARRQLTKIALYAIRFLPKNQIDNAKWLRKIEACSHDEACFGAAFNHHELEPLLLWLRSQSHLSDSAPNNSELLSMLVALTDVNTPKIWHILRAVDMAAILQARRSLSKTDIQRLFAALERVPATRRRSLRFQLASEAAWNVADHTSEELKVLRREVAARRADDPSSAN